MIRLLLCDLDGTLVETWRTTPLPDVRERLQVLQDQGIPVVVVTNQGGVGYRYPIYFTNIKLAEENI